MRCRWQRPGQRGRSAAAAARPLLLDVRTLFRQGVEDLDAIAELFAALRVSEYQVFRNAQIKEYPDGRAVVTVFDRNIIRAPGFEAAGGPSEPQELPEAAAAGEDKPEDEERRAAANMARSKRRARAAVYDLALASDFEFFATFTVDPARVRDRLDDEEVFRHLHDWLDNNVRRRGLAYVLVPEYHKKGGLHFHALINGALEVADSGTLSVPGWKRPARPRSEKQRQRWLAAGAAVVYNLPGWSFGFSTAIRLYGDRAAAVGYLVKYITKGEAKIGGRWYYSGGELKRPRVSVTWLDFDRAAALNGGEVFTIDELGAAGVRLHIKEDDLVETLDKLRGAAGPVLDSENGMG